MSDYEQAVFVSYAWGGEREEVVNQIDEALKARGIKIVRDKRDLGYKGSIKEFMERIGQGNCVIVVISDKYLRSPNCMFELVEIADGKEFHERIFPVVLSDANIYDPLRRIEYIKFWEGKIGELDKAMREVGMANLQGIRDEIDQYTRIRARIAELTDILKDMNTLTPDMHRDSEFDEIYDGIARRMKESVASAPATPSVPAPENQLIETAYFEPQTILIPAGLFWMGSDAGPGIPAYESPRHEVFVPEFRMGKTPVTNVQYEEFVREMHRSVAPEMGWDGQKVPAGAEKLPAVGVTFYEAIAYCDWLSKKTNRKYSLPNEAQWEKACRGENNFIYPWGDEVDTERSNQGQPSLSIVDFYPEQNDYGVFDMVGDVRQWTCTVWGEKRIAPDARYAYPYKDDGRNDLNASRQLRRVVRGSAMKDDIKWLRCSARSGQAPDDVGLPGARHSFRVVMNV
jgi:formylglycine-generating enzyme required for sulfatase activity